MLLPCLAGLAAEGAGPAEVAQVNGQAITRQALIGRLMADLGESLLEKMIQEKIVEQAATKAGVIVTEEEIEASVGEARAALPTHQTLESMLAAQGMSMVTFREQVRMRLRLKKLVLPEIKMSDDALRRYYTANSWMFEKKERVEVYHIFHAIKQKLELERMKIAAGQVEFEDVAARLVKEAERLANLKGDFPDRGGGKMGWITRDRADLGDEFLDLAFRLKPGAWGGPVKTQLGYHLVKVLAHEEAERPPFDKVKDDVRAVAQAQEVQRRMGERLSTLLKQAKVERMLNGEVKE